MLAGEHAAGAAHAALDFVGDEQDAVALADGSQFVEELGRRHDVAAFALDGLDEDGGDLFGREDRLEELVFEDLDAFDVAGVRLLAVSAAVAVGVGDVGDAAGQRSEALFLDGLGAGERERAHGAAVEAAEEGDELVAAGVIAGQLEGGLDGLGAGVAEVDAFGLAAGGEGGELLGEVDHVLVIEVGAGHVDEAFGLPANGFDDARVAVAGGDDGDAGVEVEEAVAVDVVDHGAFAVVDDQRVVARVAGARARRGRAR